MRAIALSISLAALASLAGCAIATEVKGPSGKNNYSIKCGGDMIEKCYQKAAELCPKGYEFADRMASNGPAVITRVGTSFIAAPGPNNMLVECKE